MRCASLDLLQIFLDIALISYGPNAKCIAPFKTHPAKRVLAVSIRSHRGLDVS